MYPIFDETLYTALKNSDETILTTYKIKLPGPKVSTPDNRYIIIQNSDDELEKEGFGFDERRIYYVLEIGVKRLKYIEAMRTLRDITAALKRVIYTSPDMVYTPLDEDGEPITEDSIDFRGEVRIDKVIPEYDTKSNVVKKAHLQLSVSVTEDYDIPEEEFDETDISGEFL